MKLQRHHPESVSARASFVGKATRDIVNTKKPWAHLVNGVRPRRRDRKRCRCHCRHRCRHRPANVREMTRAARSEKPAKHATLEIAGGSPSPPPVLHLAAHLPEHVLAMIRGVQGELLRQHAISVIASGRCKRLVLARLGDVLGTIRDAEVVPTQSAPRAG